MKRRRFSLSGSGQLGLAIILVMLVSVVVGPFLVAHPPDEILGFEVFAPPGGIGVLGTDYLGRDMLSRLLSGGRLSIALSFLATLSGFLVGVVFGFYAAEVGGWVENAMFRLVDVLISLPPILLALVVIVSFGSSIPVLIATVTLVHAPRVARVSRAVASEICTREFVEAARARGESIWSILKREILPNSLLPLSAEFGLRMAYSILLLAALSFLGLGIQPPHADWGAMVRENMSGLFYGGWSVLLPATAIGLLVISVNLFFDSLGSRAHGNIPDELVA